jgi:serine/threonine protein kinase
MNDSTQVEEIFAQAMQLPDAEDRRNFVKQVCRGHLELEKRVYSLLTAAADAGRFLERPLRFSDDATEPSPLNNDSQQSPPKESFSFLSAPTAPDELGMIGPYHVLQCIGRGGMGIVFQGFDPKLRRVVAIKVLAPAVAVSPIARKRFEREARSAAAVNHPNVVVIHAVDETHNPPYLVMEFVNGKDLGAKIRTQGMLSIREILRIGAQMAKALAAAHKQGLVHRDLKPANVLLENGVERVKVTDFGLARTVDDQSLTRYGDLTGTPEFMSPEQATPGAPVDCRSDLFSLGSVLYTMCTGSPPFRGDHPLTTMKKICENTQQPIQLKNPDAPEWLCAIVDRLLAKSPADRYQTATEVANVLQNRLAALQGQPNSVGQPVPAASMPTPTTEPFWLRKKLVACTLGIAAAIGFFGWLAAKQINLHRDAVTPSAADHDPAQPSGFSASPKASGRHPVMVVLPFENQSKAHQEISYEVGAGNNEDNPKRTFTVDRFSEAPRSILEDVLANMNGPKVVERQRVDSLLMEAEFGAMSGLVDQEKGVRLGKMLGANEIVMGTIIDLRDDNREFDGYGIKRNVTDVVCQIRIRVIEIETGAVRFSKTVQAKKTFTASSTGATNSSDRNYAAVETCLHQLNDDSQFEGALVGDRLPKN